ncbi:hypothetical protein CEXT_277181 [Caerostris extrusa]|uniref:Uncharacterized protein n=1 Tax=Caerostris extrusa TaxID=172846 RepID=A0AAV4RGD0_CAEEX|nr:hypothetical protein CEXT_277181 [Caerostris extrusa]
MNNLKNHLIKSSYCGLFIHQKLQYCWDDSSSKFLERMASSGSSISEVSVKKVNCAQIRSDYLCGIVIVFASMHLDCLDLKMSRLKSCISDISPSKPKELDSTSWYCLCCRK